MHKPTPSRRATSLCGSSRALWLAALALALLVGCIEHSSDPARLASPRDQGSWVLDGAGLIGEREKDINRVLDKLEADVGAEVAVVTVYSIGPDVPKDFATVLFEHWGIGKAGQDNGVLILHVVDQRRVEIETGYGAEQVLTDARAKRIIDEVTIPFFKAESFGDGHYETVRAIDHALRNGGSLNGRAEWERQPGEVVDIVSPGATVPTRNEVAYPDSPLGYTLVLLVVLWLVAVHIARARFASPRALTLHEKSGPFLYVATAAGVVLLTGSLWGYVVGSVFAVPSMVLVALVRWRTSRAKPDLHRVCRRCQAGMRAPLSESEEDAFLSEAQRVEERIGAFDYDVWACPCGEVLVEARESWGSASACPGCSHKTVVAASNLVRAPTHEQEGSLQVTADCALCDFHEVTLRTLPKLEAGVSTFSIGAYSSPSTGHRSPSWGSSSSSSWSSSSSSSWGSSSSSSSSSGGSFGSFGGGRSGGGGAGGSY